ncbi:hypothetical protein [Singulisphaera acidiphila]|uniref:Uncharacterized protein n=1 Tax=Singulisphaera acidiphila (strain ATCC BAA-1392 / DSM 18658 / VKM B-2454 / MOB10) TaxID=886293 RepID=L0DKI6_SINAD|nr:hypothetical protein [Singulisphaera acidiphila]AGA29350.1 hypothetical protein Sinac_5198 [Singulisphaera acidiphila DSM 18658]
MTGTSTPAPTQGERPEPQVRGESIYDQVTSLLMAIVIGALLVVGWLALVYATNQAYASRVTAPLEIVDVFGGGGGSPDGTPGSTEKIDVAGAEVAAQASNNEEVAGDFEEPSVQETPAAMLDAVADAGQTLAEVDLGAVMPTGGAVASGRKASKIGTGGPGLGLGPGDGGVPREQRWSIVYNPGQTPDEYARQLDALKVELAVVSGPNQLTYISNFSNETPTKRRGSGQGDDRLYFLWQGRGRKASDVALLQKAGIEVGEGVVIQFYPKQVENTLAQLEVRYRGKQPAEIRVTRFSVVPKGDGYGFAVLAQETLH